MIATLALLALSFPRAQAPAPVHPDLAGLTERWRAAMEACGVPALAVVVVEGDEVVHRVTLGRRDPARAEPVTSDTMFYIASATKPFVAFACEQLAEQGKLDLDAPVKRYLPRFRLADPALTESITVRDLLCHRPGLESTPAVLLDAYTGEITEERYYHFLAEVEPLGKVTYSNLHFTLAGRVVEAVSGQNWRDYLAEHLFRPAGMLHTTGYADWMFAQDDVAVPAVLVDGQVQATELRKTDRTMHAAGGLGTSIDDLARWIRLQLGRGTLDGRTLLGGKTIEAGWQLQARGQDDGAFGPVDGFGLGWQHGNYRGHLELRHGGGYVGAGSYVCFLPELGLGLGVLATGGAGAGALCQLVSTDVHERLLADDEIRDPLPGLLERVRSAMARDRQRQAEERAALAVPLQLSRPAASYAGTYRNEWFGTVTLVAEGERLAGHLGDIAFELTTPALDQALLYGSGPAEGTEGRFEIRDGQVLAFTLDLVGPVRFER